MTSRGLRAALIGLLAGAAWAQPGADAQAATAEAGPERPNIVVILSDDEDLVSHAFMPKTKALIEEQGAAFDNYFVRSEEHTSELQSLMRISYAVFCLKKKKTQQNETSTQQHKKHLRPRKR